jgi:NAD+ synthase
MVFTILFFPVKKRQTSSGLGPKASKIQRFISDYISESSFKGVVVGLSGGLDSAVVLQLAVNALGRLKVLGLIMPSQTTPSQDTHDAEEQAKELGIEYKVIDINLLLQKYGDILPSDKRAMGNLMARIRMNILYYYASLNCYLVAGTSDRSELLLGYYTKWGDGAADIMPIARLYKTQVRALAKFLKIPQAIIEKKSSPRLWHNHLAEEEIGMNYETIDRILYLLVDKKRKPKDVAKVLGILVDDVIKIKNMMETNEHKRRHAPAP